MRVALVTGAAGGLGTALVSAFRRAGWQVGAGVHRHALAAAGDGVLPVSLDVTSDAACRGAVAEVRAHWGRIDCLVNNAGVACDRSLGRLTEADWDRVVDVNLDGAMRCARAVLGEMVERRDGHILNISSFAARAGTLGQAAYAAAKAGLLGFTQSLAYEVGRRNVRVNAVLPGVLPTGMTAGLAEETLSAFARSNVLGRLNRLEEVAAFVVFLAGMRDVSGQVFQLDSRVARWT